jgi:hypothetical protein
MQGKGELAFGETIRVVHITSQSDCDCHIQMLQPQLASDDQMVNGDN